MKTPELCEGGAQATVTNTEVVIDMGVLQGYDVMIYCDEQDIWFSASSTNAGTLALVTAGAQSASTTALVADRIARGEKCIRTVGRDRYLVVRTVKANSSGVLKVKVVRKFVS